MKGNRPPFQGGRSGQDLNGRKVLLGVCGGIAAYKVVELARLLIKSGARVQVVMTHAAEKFIAPLTFPLKPLPAATFLSRCSLRTEIFLRGTPSLPVGLTLP
jgi:hypothetical protein